MSTSLEELLHDHFRSPRNKGDLLEPLAVEVGHNPLCGDLVKISVAANSTTGALSFHFSGHGCSLSLASASIATELMAGLTGEEAAKACRDFVVHLKDGSGTIDNETLALLAQIRRFPVRSKCVRLPFETLAKAAQKTPDS